ncbi:hypothetical protein HDV63DRAFT_385629 [Trichoderma sp. SZMC 28014]
MCSLVAELRLGTWICGSILSRLLADAIYSAVHVSDCTYIQHIEVVWISIFTVKNLKLLNSVNILKPLQGPSISNIPSFELLRVLSCSKLSVPSSAKVSNHRSVAG